MASAPRDRTEQSELPSISSRPTRRRVFLRILFVHRDAVTVELTGMGFAGGFSLLVVTGFATSLAIGVLKLREWARIVSIASIGAGIAFAVFSLFAFRRYVVIPVVPSIACRLLVMVVASGMAEYLSRDRVKQLFSASTA
jgi:hypothetical protein